MVPGHGEPYPPTLRLFAFFDHPFPHPLLQVFPVLARIIHERSRVLHLACEKADEHVRRVAGSPHYRLDVLKIHFPLFISEARLRE